ncbi:phosphoserine transaminase [Arsenicicoccus dermatophilus]|uniref:phosphoserine transaminase n=1 Tax=Arsenicicoccus dermatophilus TaxID=1076331 RepID=UPI003916F35D
MADHAPTPPIVLPAELRPADGRFGSGPSRLRPAQVQRLLADAQSVLGTSHRQDPVLRVVAELRRGLAELFALPDGYEVVLGNGGSTAFWDVAALGLVRERVQHVVVGEFSAKFAEVTSGAPFLAEPDVRRSAPGTRTAPVPVADVDCFAWPHNETSTGVMLPVERIGTADQLVLVDATSAAGALPLDVSCCDAYYLAPQKVLGSDGGLWLALLSPAAIERAGQIAATDRWIPASLSLTTAIAASRKDQTYNTPALATLLMAAEQVSWLNAQGGLDWACRRAAESSSRVYAWAGSRDWARPFVADPAARSPVVCTVDLVDEIDAATVSRVLRANGIVDTEPYRRLGRNQLRIATFPAVEPRDVEILTRAVDHVVARL